MPIKDKNKILLFRLDEKRRGGIDKKEMEGMGEEGVPTGQRPTFICQHENGTAMYEP